MELKKSPKANLEGKRPLLIITGALIAMCFSLVAFEWRTPYEINHDPYFPEPLVLIDIDDIPIVIEKDEQKKEIPKPEPPKHITNQFTKVDDNTVIKEDPSPEPDTKPNPTEELGKMFLPTAIGTEPDPEPEPPIRFPDKMPTFKCIKDSKEAEDELMNFVKERIRYPQRAIESNITGKVFVQFVVDKTGNVKDIEILRGIGYGCDEEVIRVLKSLPEWCPGYHQGKYRDTYFTMPVHFKL